MMVGAKSPPRPCCAKFAERDVRLCSRYFLIRSKCMYAWEKVFEKTESFAQRETTSNKSFFGRNTFRRSLSCLEKIRRKQSLARTTLYLVFMVLDGRVHCRRGRGPAQSNKSEDKKRQDPRAEFLHFPHLCSTRRCGGHDNVGKHW